jgi:hypothetical protein
MSVSSNETRLPAGLAALCTALALAACGGTGGGAGGQPASSAAPAVVASTLAARMKQAVRSATSVHISGRLISDGQVVGLDIGVLRSGQLSGTVTRQGVPLRIVVTGGAAYVRATPAFLRQLHVPASVCGLICGRYVRLPAAKTRALAQSLSLAGLTSSLTGRTPALRDAGARIVDGQRAVVLRTANGGIIEVAGYGRPYPVAARSPGGRHGALSFSQWNSVPLPAPPPKSQVVNAGRLG